MPCTAAARLGVGGLGFRVCGLGFKVWGIGFRVCGLGFRVALKTSTFSANSNPPQPDKASCGRTVGRPYRARLGVPCLWWGLQKLLI